MDNKAYLDSFSGLIPCIVLDVQHNDCTVKITKTLGGYKRGEIISRHNIWIFPRKAVYTRYGMLRIRPYKWLMDDQNVTYIINP